MKEKRKILMLVLVCLLMTSGIYTVGHAATATKMHTYFIDRAGKVSETVVYDPVAMVKTTSSTMSAVVYSSQKLTINNLQADTLRLYTGNIQLQGKSEINNLIVNEPVKEVTAATGTEFSYKTISGRKADSFLKSLPNDLTVSNGSISKGTISLDKTSASIYEKGTGNTVTLKATVNGSGTVKWTSSDAKVATVKDGVVTGVAKGSATITATLYNSKGAKVTAVNCSVTVKEATLTLDKSAVNTYAKGTGNTATITATVNGVKVAGNAVTWKSLNAATATVSNGVITGVKTGTTTVTATVNGISKNVSVTVKDPTLTLNRTSGTIYTKGTTTVTLTATVNGTAVAGSGATWTTSDKSVATVENGKVTAVSKGKATITAKANGVSKTCTITVNNPSVVVSPKEVTIKKGKTTALTVTVRPASGTPTYTTSRKSVATVSSTGVVTGVAAGEATITVKCNGASATVAVTVK